MESLIPTTSTLSTGILSDRFKQKIFCFSVNSANFRKWMIVDEKGSFLSQRKLPRMALIKQRYEDNFLILSAPGMHEIKVSVDVPLKQKECRF